MAQPLIVPLPPNIVLWSDCQIRVTAVNPTTGATVAGVNVSNLSLEVDVTKGRESDLAYGPFLLVTGPGG